MEVQSVEIRILASCEPAKFGKFYEDITALLKKEGEAQTINKASLNVEYRDNRKFVVGSSGT